MLRKESPFQDSASALFCAAFMLASVDGEKQEKVGRSRSSSKPCDSAETEARIFDLHAGLFQSLARNVPLFVTLSRHTTTKLTTRKTVPFTIPFSSTDFQQLKRIASSVSPTVVLRPLPRTRSAHGRSQDPRTEKHRGGLANKRLG